MDVVRAAQRLADASEEDVFLRHALASSHVAIDTFGKILGLSADVALFLGSTGDRLVGRRLLHRIAGADRTRFQRALSHLRGSGAPFAIDVKLRTADGVLRAAVLSLAAFGGPGRPSVAVLRVSAGEGST